MIANEKRALLIICCVDSRVNTYTMLMDPGWHNLNPLESHTPAAL